MALFHPRQQRAVCPHQRPQSCAAVRVDLADENNAFLVEAPGAFRFEFEQRLHSLRERTLQIVFGAAESLEIFLRQIDAAHFEVGSHVADNVRQLKREAQPLRKIGIARIAETKNVQARESHGSCHAIAILRKLVECRIAGDG